MQSLFIQDEMKTVIKDSIDETIGSQQFQHDKVNPPIEPTSLWTSKPHNHKTSWQSRRSQIGRADLWVQCRSNTGQMEWERAALSVWPSSTNLSNTSVSAESFRIGGWILNKTLHTRRQSSWQALLNAGRSDNCYNAKEWSWHASGYVWLLE